MTETGTPRAELDAASATTAAGSDPVWWDAWRGLLFASAQILGAVEPDLRRHSDMSLAFMDVLGRLYDAPERQLRMQELQARSLFTRGGMTRLVDRIEQAGLVRRLRVPGDRRGVFVELTSEGVQAYANALARHRADIEREFASRLSPDEHQAVADALAQFWRG